MLFKFNCFRSNQNQKTIETPSYEENVLVTNQEETAPSNNTSLMNKLFKRSSFYAGPDVMYENEAWAPVRSTGLFHRKRAILEEQSSSTTEAQ